MNKVWAVLLVLVFFSLSFLIVRDDKAPLPSGRQQGASFIEGIRVVHKNKGRNDWVMTAKRANIIGNGDKADLSDIEVTIKDKNVTILAEKGLYDIHGKKLTINGAITAKDRDYTITSRDVEFDNATGVLKTDGKVTLTGRKFTLTGIGMQADNKEQKVRILSNVSATYYN